jgi:hypothetical protein
MSRMCWRVRTHSVVQLVVIFYRTGSLRYHKETPTVRPSPQQIYLHHTSLNTFTVTLPFMLRSSEWYLRPMSSDERKTCLCIHFRPYILYIYRVSQEECAKLRESASHVKVYRYNPKHLYQKLNGYGDNGQRKVWSSCGFTYCTY